MTRKDYVLPEIRADPGRKSRSFSLRGSPVLRSEGYGETAGFLYAGASRGPRFRLRRILRTLGRYCTA